MWRRLNTLAVWRSALGLRRSVPQVNRSLASLHSSSPSSSPFQNSPPFFSQHGTSDIDVSSGGKKRVEDVMPIATGLEREEIEAELEGSKRFDLDPPVGPFGTKEAPAIIKSSFNKRLVGCPGGEGEDEHDVVWFWLEKGKPHECPVCSQYFMLEVVGEGGPPPEDGLH
ncbi:cytochrome c oxidase subunit 5b-1, mitochondrial isoform X1 [Aristolochia californica]|uniref:cytochrome c oxidase subunit 5b-1, mitochondrial isoform X1 n=1 Tax=Aristolochia californica TaxID=171875 RepID=UPI0035D8C8E5